METNTTNNFDSGPVSPLIIWSEDYNTGIQEIDRQHQKLIVMIDELHSAMLGRKTHEILGNILDGLVSYTVYHFGTEEKYFEHFNYALAADHKKEHAEFTQKVLTYQDSFKQGKQDISLKVLNFLSVWLRNHIRGSDRKVCQFLIMKGFKSF
jgi:hemerythrin